MEVRHADNYIERCEPCGAYCCAADFTDCRRVSADVYDISDSAHGWIGKAAVTVKKVHAPIHELAMMMSLALRFIPTLVEETDKIMSAQRAAARILTPAD